MGEGLLHRGKGSHRTHSRKHKKSGIKNEVDSVKFSVMLSSLIRHCMNSYPQKLEIFLHPHPIGNKGCFANHQLSDLGWDNFALFGFIGFMKCLLKI